MLESEDGRSVVEYYFNTKTGEVEEGKHSSWMDRMGPYATREEAAHAYELAARRTAASDAADTQWESGWGDSDEEPE